MSTSVRGVPLQREAPLVEVVGNPPTGPVESDDVCLGCDTDETVSWLGAVDEHNVWSCIRCGGQWKTEFRLPPAVTR